MNKLKRKLIRRARREFKKIRPCGGKDNLLDCFTVHEDKLIFWFNTTDNSTHLLTTPAAAVSRN